MHRTVFLVDVQRASKLQKRTKTNMPKVDGTAPPNYPHNHKVFSFKVKYGYN